MSAGRAHEHWRGIRVERLRKQISTRTRFEIFKRDRFACQYCGRTPPTVILHVDHIEAVCNGGGNDPLNLITSCDQCNQGKAGVPLGSVVQPIKDALLIERERAAQVAEYNAMLRELRLAKEIDFQSVSDALIRATGKNADKLIISGQWAASVRAILKRIPSELVLEAVEIANDKCNFKRNTYKAWKYFCGVCWRTIGRAEGTES